MSEKKKYSFKCLEQNCTNRVCCTRPHVSVTIGDLARWSAQGYLDHILPGVTINVPKSEGERFSMETIRKPLNGDGKEGENAGDACIFFHKESNACTIRYSRPISCRTFPLLYNGEKFVLSDKSCPGIGQGEITKEALKEARDLAEQEYRERMETIAALPAIYALIMGHMLRQSAEAMKNLSEEDRKKLEEIMSKTPAKETDTGADTDDSGEGSAN
ncbi:MAG: YkgJ family cysteine cluster protein [Candidatus Thorarchaeota archaeon]